MLLCCLGDNMKQHDIAVTNRNFSDFNPVVCGYHVCDGGFCYGPNIRQYVLLHYVESGKGTFIRGGKEYSVHENQVFVILPGEVTKYFSDSKDPWVYSWIGFTGSIADRFGELAPVFDLKTDLFSAMLKAEDYKSCREEFLCARLWELYCLLFEDTDIPYDYVKQACDYITAHYTGDIRICDIAQVVGLERTYLSKLFRQKTGISMQGYLINVRMEQARKLLKQGYNVSQAAKMCGYEDPFNFSRMFKKKFGVSPGRIR